MANTRDKDFLLKLAKFRRELTPQAMKKSVYDSNYDAVILLPQLDPTIQTSTGTMTDMDKIISFEDTSIFHNDNLVHI